MSQCAVECRDVSFSYGERKAVEELSLCVEHGSLHALVGPDGAGKSTLIKLIATLLKPDRGEVLIHGINAGPDREVRKLIGYLPQEFNLYPDLTVRETLEFFGSAYGMNRKELKERINELVEIVDLEEKLDARAGSLSGGMKQKLLLITSIIHNPPVLLLDEPSTGIDPVSRHEIWQYIYSLHNQGTTILIATPFMDEAERCEKVTFLYDGKKLIEGSPEDLRLNFKYKVFELETDSTAKIENIEGIVDIETYSNRIVLVTLPDFDPGVINAREVEPNLEIIFQQLLKEVA